MGGIWGKVQKLGLSTIEVTYPQSYPLGCPRRVWGDIRKSTDPTNTTT